MAEAEPLLRDALEGYRRVLGDQHQATLNAIVNLARVLEARQALPEAELLHREALALRRHLFGDIHPETLDSVRHLGSVLRRLGRGVEALELADEAVMVGTRFGESDWRVGTLLVERGHTLRSLERYEEAADAILQAHETIASALGDEHPETRQVMIAVADLHEAWHAADPDAGHDGTAAEWRAKLQPSAVPDP